MQMYHFYVLSASSDPDNYRYLGVTSRTVKQRFYGHKYCAMHENKRVLPVHKWMYKHYQSGDDILVKEIHTCDKTMWKTEEKRLIKEYKDAGYKLLNLQEGGEGIVTKDMRNDNGINRSIEAHKKAIVAIDPNTLELRYTFNSIKEATAFFNKNSKSSISNALNQNNNSKNYTKSCGYYWLYKEDYDNNGIISINTNVIPKKNQQYIYQFDLNGNLINSFWNIREMECKKVISFHGLKNAISKKHEYRGYFWSYNDNINLSEYKSNLENYKFEEIDSSNNSVRKYKKLDEIVDVHGHSSSFWSTKIKEGFIFENGNKIIKIKI